MQASYNKLEKLLREHKRFAKAILIVGFFLDDRGSNRAQVQPDVARKHGFAMLPRNAIEK